MNRVAQWEKDRVKLKKLYLKLGITTCEVHLPGCTRDNFLGFAHRHKRSWYYNKPHLLGTIKQTVLACNSCHDQMEYSPHTTEYIFTKLRGQE